MHHRRDTPAEGGVPLDLHTPSVTPGEKKACLPGLEPDTGCILCGGPGYVQGEGRIIPG